MTRLAPKHVAGLCAVMATVVLAVQVSRSSTVHVFANSSPAVTNLPPPRT